MHRLLVSIFSMLLLFSIKGYSTDYYWIGGSGDWSDINHWVTTSGGTINHIQTPTSLDNVIFDANSFSADANINLNIATIFCKDFNTEQITHNLTLAGICSVWKIYGGFKVGNKTTFSNPKLYFEAQSGSHIIKISKQIGNEIYFKGNATWVLHLNLSCGNVYLEGGTFNTNSKELWGLNFKSNTANTRGLVLGNSEISFNRWEVNGVSYSVNAGTSEISIRGSVFRNYTNSNLVYNDLYLLKLCAVDNSTLQISFRKVQFFRGGSISGSNSYDSLIFKKGYSYLISSSTTQTINQALMANGDCKKKVTIQATNSFATFYKTSGAVYCSYLVLKHIHASGGASFYASATDDLGDNIGWIMTPPAARTLYWVGSTGNWSDTLHWSYTSGGPGGECIPTIVDDVIIDTNSYNYPSWNLSINGPGICHDITWETDAVGVLRLGDILSIAGSMFLGENLTMATPGIILFISRDLGETIHTSNIDLHKQHIQFKGKGSWTLMDSVKNEGGEIYLVKGHLLTNGNYIIADIFSATSKSFKKLSLFNSTIDVIKQTRIQQDSLFIYPGTSHIRMIGSQTHFWSDGPFPDSLYNLSFVADSGSAISDVGYTTFNKVQHMVDVFLTGYSIADTLVFKKGCSFKFNLRTDSIKKALIANGNCTEIITMREHTAMDQFVFIMPSTATVSASHLNIRGSKAIGGANFFTINSSDLGNNSGWSFVNNPIDHYWVSGNGNWQDSSHWSYSSGGQGGACIPKIYDDVYFDGNSFSSTFDTVIVDTNNIFCRDMDWTGASGNPVFDFDTSTYVHFISGSLELIQNMTFNMVNETFYVWDQQNKTIDMAGNIYNGDIIFADTGRWTLQDTLIVESNIFHHSGGLITNLYPVETQSYFGEYNEPKTLDINNNIFTIILGGLSQSFTWINNYQTQLLANKSEIIFEHGGLLQTSGTGQVPFYNVSFMDSLAYGEVNHTFVLSDRFNKLLFQGNGRMAADNYMDTLIFSKGRNYDLEGGRHQYITNDWQANADCYGFIAINGLAFSSISPSATAQVHMINGNVNLYGVLLKNVNGIGSGSFTIMNGTDMGGNSSNWQITPYPSRILYWVNNSGDWWDTTHWSLSSGGPGGECIPTYVDDVHFTQSSFISTSDTAFSFNNIPIDCHSMYWNFTPDTPHMEIRYLNIYGSLWLGDTMTLYSSTEAYFHALDTGNIIRSANKKLRKVYFQSSGEWSLKDEFRANDIFHNKGSLKSLGNPINAYMYKSTSSGSSPSLRKLNITNSEFRVEREMIILTDNFTLISTNSHIRYNSTTTNPQFDLSLSGVDVLHFNKVSFEPPRQGFSRIVNSTPSHHTFSKMTINNSADIYGEHYFDSLVFHAGNTYQLEESKTQHIDSYWFVRGNNCFALTLQSTNKYNQAYVTKSAGAVTGDFINMRDIYANGGASFFAGAFSTDISNNTGWVFANGPQYVYGLGPDTSFSLGSNVTLSSANFNGGPNTTYIWSTGSTNPNITINQTGWYYITVSYAGACTVYDSIWVGCNLGMAYNIIDNPCFGDSLGSIKSLVPDTNYTYDYLWSTSEITDSIGGLAAGSYTIVVSADNGFCMLYDTLDISEPPPVICPQGDTAFCLGDSVMLDLGNFVTYFWTDGYNTQYRWVSQKDSFIVQVEDIDGCWSSPDTIDIRQDLPPLIAIGEDTTICLGAYLEFDAGDGYDAYLWSNNSAMSSINVQYTGTYWVKVFEKTCIVMDTVNVYNCPAKFIVPNVFTPNGDGKNDVFEIEYQNIWEFEIRIYNRWGSRVYRSSDLEKPWNGMIKGQEAVEGVYFWEIIYEEYDGKGDGYEAKKVKGTVTLFRNSY